MVLLRSCRCCSVAKWCCSSLRYLYWLHGWYPVKAAINNKVHYLEPMSITDFPKTKTWANMIWNTLSMVYTINGRYRMINYMKNGPERKQDTEIQCLIHKQEKTVHDYFLIAISSFVPKQWNTAIKTSHMLIRLKWIFFLIFTTCFNR